MSIRKEKKALGIAAKRLKIQGEAVALQIKAVGLAAGVIRNALEVVNATRCKSCSHTFEESGGVVIPRAMQGRGYGKPQQRAAIFKSVINRGGELTMHDEFIVPFTPEFSEAMSSVNVVARLAMRAGMDISDNGDRAILSAVSKDSGRVVSVADVTGVSPAGIDKMVADAVASGKIEE